MWEIWVQSLDWEYPLEKEKAIHSSILAWRIPQTVQSMGHKEMDTTEWLSFTHSQPLLKIQEQKKGCWGAKAVYYTYPQHTPPPKGKAKHPTTPAQPLDSPLSSLLISNQLAHPGSKQGDPLPVFASPAIAGALTKPWLNFLTNLLSISTDWGRTRILVCIRSNVWSNYSIPVIYLKKTETPIWKDTWTQLFTALITIAKIWKQPKCVHQQMNW